MVLPVFFFFSFNLLGAMRFFRFHALWYVTRGLTGMANWRMGSCRRIFQCFWIIFSMLLDNLSNEMIFQVVLADESGAGSLLSEAIYVRSNEGWKRLRWDLDYTLFEEIFVSELNFGVYSQHPVCSFYVVSGIDSWGYLFSTLDGGY